MKLVISLLVHEQEDVVLDQIRNFKYFVPGVSILVHISRRFRRSSPGLADRLISENKVLVNPISLDTAWAEGSQAEAHLVNLRYLFKSGQEFDGCIFHASNDLYVREGAIDYLKGQDAACGVKPVKYHPDWCQQVSKDRVMPFLAARFGTEPLWSEIEGSFYTWKVLRKMLAVLDEYKPGLMEIGLRRLPSFFRKRWRIRNAFNGVFYPREETLFPTLAKSLIKNRVEPFCLRKINIGETVSIEDVNRMRAGEFDSGSNPMRKYFVLKRINRVFDDPVRCFIRKFTLETSG